MEKIEKTVETGQEGQPKKEQITAQIESISNSEAQKIEANDEKKLLEARENVEALESPNDKKSSEIVQKEISNYIEKNIPSYLQSQNPSLVYKIFKKLSGLMVKEVIGKENLPANSKLYIANHRGEESGKLIAALDKPVHVVSAERVNWKNGEAFRWLSEKLGMVPVRETLSNLTDEQKEAVLEKVRFSEKKAHEEVAFGKPVMGGGNIKNIKAMVALLLRGDDVAIFAEGLLSRLKNDERKAYAGFALIAREYKRISGKDLDIIPTGIRKGKVKFGEKFNIDQTGKQSKEDLQEIATKKIHELYNSLG